MDVFLGVPSAELNMTYVGGIVVDGKCQRVKKIIRPRPSSKLVKILNVFPGHIVGKSDFLLTVPG